MKSSSFDTMSGLRAPIFVRALNHNHNVNDDIDAEFSFTQRATVINQSKYSLSVNRVVVPTSRIPHFHMGDTPTEYYVAISPKGGVLDDGDDMEDIEYPPNFVPPNIVAFGQILDHSANNPTWLAHTKNLDSSGVQLSEYQHLDSYFNGSAELIYENINRAFQRAYLGAMWKMQWDPNVTNPYDRWKQYHWKETIIRDSFTDRMDITTEQLQAGRVRYGTFNFMPSGEATYNKVQDWGKICGIILHMRHVTNKIDFNVRSYDTHTTFLAFDKITSVNAGIELVSPEYEDEDGETVQTTYTLIPGGTYVNMKSVYLSEGAVQHMAGKVGNISNKHLIPIDSFQTAANIPFAGSAWEQQNSNVQKAGLWSVYVTFDPSINGMAQDKMWEMTNKYQGQSDARAVDIVFSNMDFGMYCFSNYGFLPTLTPTLGRNATGKLEIQVQNAWLNGSCSVLVSPRLRDLLNLGTGYFQSFTMPAPNDVYKFEKLVAPHDQSGIPTNINVINSVGATMVYQNHTNIKSIDIVATGLDVTHEIQSDESPNDVLMSLAVNPDALNKSQITFSYGGSTVQTKRFYFRTGGRLDRFELKLYVTYKTGHRELLSIAPSEYAEVLLVFEPLFKR